MPDSSIPLARLKRRLERLETPRVKRGAFALGPALDARLGGGLALGALHEIWAGSDRDQASASGFAAMLASLAAGDRPILWVREDKADRAFGRLYGAGLVELGIDPDRLILMMTPDTLSALRTASDVLSCFAAGAVIVETFGATQLLDLTASRKLVLGAEKLGIAAFLLRNGEGRFSSAAATRWRVSAAPSQPLPADAPGHTAFAVDLVRHRGGVPPFSLTVEWNRDARAFREAPLSRAVPAAASGRPLAA